MGILTSVVYMMICNECCNSVYAYFFCKLVCTFMILMQSRIARVLLRRFNIFCYAPGFLSMVISVSVLFVCQMFIMHVYVVVFSVCVVQRN